MMFKSPMKPPTAPTPRWLPPGLQITCHVEAPLPPPLRGWSVSGRHAYSPGLLKSTRMLECSWERQGALRGAWVFHCVTIPRWGKISTAKRQRWLFLFVSLLGLMRKCGPRCFRNSAALILKKKRGKNAAFLLLTLDIWLHWCRGKRKPSGLTCQTNRMERLNVTTSGVSKGRTAARMLLDTQRWLPLKWGFLKALCRMFETVDHWVYHWVLERFLNL